jgi:hypothetical protein
MPSTGGSDAPEVSYVPDEHVVPAAYLGLTVLRPDQPSGRELVRSFFQLLVHDLAWIAIGLRYANWEGKSVVW